MAVQSRLKKVPQYMNQDIERYKILDQNRCLEKKNFSLYLFPWSPLFPLFVHRFGYRISQKWGNQPSKKFIRNAFRLLYHFGRYLSVVFWKIEIEGNATIDEGIFLSPKGGIVFGPRAMGTGCVVHHNVTIGYGFGSGKEMERPVIANNVWIGPDVAIYGGIAIGKGAVICPNTIVNKNIPEFSLVQGNPARIIAKGVANLPLLNSNSADLVEKFIEESVRN